MEGQTIFKKIKKRLKQLQTGNDNKLEIYKYIKTDNAKLEKHLHEHFKNKRLIGEWFKLKASDITRITNIIGTKNISLTKLTMQELGLLEKVNDSTNKKMPDNNVSNSKCFCTIS